MYYIERIFVALANLNLTYSNHGDLASLHFELEGFFFNVGTFYLFAVSFIHFIFKKMPNSVTEEFRNKELICYFAYHRNQEKEKVLLFSLALMSFSMYICPSLIFIYSSFFLFSILEKK